MSPKKRYTVTFTKILNFASENPWVTESEVRSYRYRWQARLAKWRNHADYSTPYHIEPRIEYIGPKHIK